MLLIVLPLMIFHQIQLMICSWLATRYGRAADAAEAAGAMARVSEQTVDYL